MRPSHLWLPLLLLSLPPNHGGAEPVRQIVPYSGHLDFDGQPFNGTAQMRFRLYTAADTPVAEDCAAEPACAWEEAKDTVRAYNGAFAVRLGESDPEAMAALVSQDTQYWLEMAVRNLPAEGGEPAPWISLTGRQAITPAPQALWTASATDLELASLGVEGPSALRGGASVTGVLHMTDGHIRDRYVERGGSIKVGSGGVQLRLDSNNVQTYLDDGNAPGSVLYIQDKGGTTILGGDSATVSGGLTVDGTLAARGALTVDESTVLRGNVAIAGQVIMRRLRYVGGTEMSNIAVGQHAAGYHVSVGQDATRSIDLPVDPATHACFITHQFFNGLDGGNDRAACTLGLTAGGGTWRLQAHTAGGASGADCAATCLNFGD